MSLIADRRHAPQILDAPLGRLVSGEGWVLSMRVVVATNMLPPYRVPVFELLADRVGDLEVLIDTHRESDRDWRVDYGRLDVRKVRSLTIRRPGPKDAGQEFHLALGLPFALLSAKPDVVISSEMGPRSLACATVLLGMRNVPLILWVGLSQHTEAGRGRLKTAVRRWLVSRSATVIVAGDSAARYIRTLSPSAHLSIAPQAGGLMPVDEHALASDSGSPRRLRFLFVGTDAPRKNLKWLVRALGEWARRREIQCSLSVVGDVSSIAASTDENLTVEVVGVAPFESMGSYYQEADALLFPTLKDEWGLVVNEAMSQGCPVIGSIWAESVIELVECGENGFSFDPRSIDTFEAALDAFVQVWRSADTNIQMRVAAVRRSRQASPSRVSESFVDAIRASIVARVS